MNKVPSFAPEGLAMSFESSQQDGSKPVPRRKLRNYLLDRNFQLKYASMVVAVTLMVSGILGALAYHYSHGQTEALSVQLALQPDLHPEVKGDLQGWAQAQDRKVLVSIALGVLILCFAIGLTSIVVTHRVVGPVYRLKKTFEEVSKGRLEIKRRLRRGDELQDVFDAFDGLLHEFRNRRIAQISAIDEALSKVDDDGVRKSLTDLRALISSELPAE